MVPMVMLLLMLDTVPMLDIPMPMVLTLMPMVPTTSERGRLRLSPRLMLMLDTPMPMVPTPMPMVATVPTWDKKFSFSPSSPSFAQFNHNRISNYLFKKAQQDKSK